MHLQIQVGVSIGRVSGGRGPKNKNLIGFRGEFWGPDIRYFEGRIFRVFRGGFSGHPIFRIFFSPVLNFEV